MSDSNYIPPQIWQWTGEKTDLNQPTSGSRYEHRLPIGKHPLQLYSFCLRNFWHWDTQMPNTMRG